MRAVLHIEVQLPPIAHDVPLKAAERWLEKASVRPREELRNRRFATFKRAVQR
jgi:hypothetical protein